MNEQGANETYDCELRQQVAELTAVNTMMREAMQQFVDRCEKGEVRSSYTYQKFKGILSVVDNNG